MFKKETGWIAGGLFEINFIRKLIVMSSFVRKVKIKML